MPAQRDPPLNEPAGVPGHQAPRDSNNNPN